MTDNKTARAPCGDGKHGYTGALPPDDFNMAAYVIGRPARQTPHAIALEVIETPDGAPGLTLDFATLEQRCLKAGQACLDVGLRPGDRVLIQRPNTSAYAEAFFGAIAVGLVPIPASDQLTPTETAFLIEDSGAALVLGNGLDAVAACAARPAETRLMAADDFDARAASATPASYAARRADDPAYLVYTSGTTAHPKGVVHAQRAAWGRWPMYAGWYGIKPADRILHAGAFNWTYTLGTGLTDPWVNGATAIVYTGEKTADVWPTLIRRSAATMFAAVPGLYRQLLKYARDDCHDLGALRHALMAGETPPPDLLDDWTGITGRPIYEALGMSEISTYISSGPQTPVRAGFAGKPQPGRSVAILPVDGDDTPLPPGEEGLLAVHRTDPGLMREYWRRPDETAEVLRGDWFVGGDLAVMDADGYVAHRGRANDVIKSLGYRISPQEVEAAFQDHPDLAEVACAEAEVKPGVHVIAMYFVPRDPHNPPMESALDAFARARLAGYKRPRAYRAVDALPRTRNGKLMRKALVW